MIKHRISGYLSNLKMKAQALPKPVESKEFKIWKKVAVFGGFFINNCFAVLCFKAGEWYGGFVFLGLFNWMMGWLLLSAKYLKFITPKYRYIYPIVLCFPVLIPLCFLLIIVGIRALLPK